MNTHTVLGFQVYRLTNEWYMIRLNNRAQFNWLKVSAWIALCLLLMASTGLAEHAVAHAQDTAPGWTGPEDISYPLSEGSDLFGKLLCDPYQNLHVLWGKSHADGSEIYYRTDKDGSLSAPVDVLAVPDNLAVQLSAAISAPDTTIHLIWANRYVQGSVYYSRAPLADAANTRAWDQPRLLVSQADSVGIFADKSGALHVIYASFEAGGYMNAVYHMRSVDSGLTWSEPALVYQVAAAEPSYLITTAAIDEAGRMYVGITLRSQDYGVNSELGYIRSLDTGQTWQPYQVIAKQSEATPNVSVITPFAFGKDEIHLTWHDPRRMHMWSSDGGVTWSNPVEIIQLGAGFGGANYLAKDSAGVLRVVTGVASGIYVSTFANSRWLTPERIENRRMDPHGQEMVVCQGNQLHIVYDDRVLRDTTVWYAHKQVNAPHIEQIPIPPSKAPSATITVSPEAHQASPTAEPTVTAERTPPLIDLTPPAISESALAPLLISTTSVVILISAALAWRERRRR